jgi:hypothetical protein
VPSEESTSFQLGARWDYQDEPEAIRQKRPFQGQSQVA